MINKYTGYVGFGVFVWIAENVYFGWNATAQSGAERLLDFISQGIIIYGVIAIVAYHVFEDQQKHE